MSEISDRELRKILDSLTLREMLIIMKLHDLIIQRLQLYTLKYTQRHKTPRSLEDFISMVIEQMNKKTELEQQGDQVDINEEKVNEFISKLRQALREDKSNEKTTS